MPEIGEAEVVRAALHRRLAGSTLTDVRALDPRLAAFAVRVQELVGIELAGVVRHGKLIGLRFADRVVVCHLRMTGALTFEPRAHARASFRFRSPDGQLHFSDPRKFGTLTVAALSDFAAGQGPDVLDQPELLPGVFSQLARSSRPLKAVLLDQSLVSGLGNWMCDELAFATAWHPLTPARELSEAEWGELMSAAHELARRSVAMGGSSLKDFYHPDGRRGRMQHELVCYGRAGNPCVRCATTLEHLKVAGRGTTVCPSCQHPPAR